MLEIQYDNITVTDGNILILPNNKINVKINVSCPCKGTLTLSYNGALIKSINFDNNYTVNGIVSPIGNINGGVLTATIDSKSSSIGIVFADKCTLVAYYNGAIVSTAPTGTRFGLSVPFKPVYLFAVPPYNYKGDYKYEVNGFTANGVADGNVEFIHVSSGTYRGKLYLSNGICYTGIITINVSNTLQA